MLPFHNHPLSSDSNFRSYFYIYRNNIILSSYFIRLFFFCCVTRMSFKINLDLERKEDVCFYNIIIALFHRKTPSKQMLKKFHVALL